MQAAIALDRGRDKGSPLPSLHGTSVCTKMDSPPSRLIRFTVSRPAGSISPMTTFATLCAKSSAAARPIPRLPPLTSATLPAKLNGVLLTSKLNFRLNFHSSSFSSSKYAPKTSSATDEDDNEDDFITFFTARAAAPETSMFDSDFRRAKPR
jgi:hypothetical protein